MNLRLVNYALFFFASMLLSTCLAGEAKNVFGNTLQACSQSGMAKTGFMRDGKCTEVDDDVGSHHICIDLSTVQSGNFCTVTGQPDWCSGTDACQDDETKSCQIKNWCVCQWAFASYIKAAGGCDEIQDVVCESVNKSALDAYEEKLEDDEIKAAYDCLRSKCDLATE